MKLLAPTFLVILALSSATAAQQPQPIQTSSEASAGPSGSPVAADADADGSAGAAPEFQQQAPVTKAVFLEALLSYRYNGTGVGLGGYYRHAIIPQGFLHGVPSIQDALSVEGGIEFRTHSWNTGSAGQYGHSYSELAFHVSAVWDLWFTEDFAAFPKVGFGFGAGWSSRTGYNSAIAFNGSYGGGFYGIGGIGALYRLGSMVLRADISNASIGMGAGLSF